MRDIVESTRTFEAWMKERANISNRLLEKKHKKMAGGAFPFLRATFYRWVEQWPAVCPRLARRDDDVLLAVGDLHVENFGVWQNSLGEHVWGVNDFDEACELPFTSDLVRLATSIRLAAEQQQVKAPDRLCGWILDGYRQALRKSGGPLLVQSSRTLRVLTKGTAENKTKFWRDKLSAGEFKRSDVPAPLAAMFRASFPRGAKLIFGEQRDPGGLGSLGRRRYTALMKGAGRIPREAREAKALLPSALYWTADEPEMRSQTATLLQHAIRSPDPFFQVHDKWLIRRLAPDVAKIELPHGEHDSRLRLAREMIETMGWETANVHLGSRSARELEARLQQVQRAAGKTWLVEASRDMAAAAHTDHQRWEKHRKKM
jgi:uncharacterized protein (DUF2252 family)